MEILFRRERLRKACESERRLTRDYGRPCAKKIMTRLADLRAAQNLGEMRLLPGNCHELTADRKGQLSIELADGKRLIFEPTDDPPPLDEGGGLDWAETRSINVVEIVDYH